MLSCPHPLCIRFLESAKANQKEPKSSLDWVFYFKLACFALNAIIWYIQARLNLERVENLPRCHPVSLTLSMIFLMQWENTVALCPYDKWSSNFNHNLWKNSIRNINQSKLQMKKWRESNTRSSPRSEMT
jgi:hypothetical protein